MFDAIFLTDVRCLSFPDAEGIWIELRFVPASMAPSTENENVMKPDRYMVGRTVVWQIIGDWAIRLDATKHSIPKHELAWKEDGNDWVSRYVHLNNFTISDIQEAFCKDVKKPCKTCNDIGCDECDPHTLEMKKVKTWNFDDEIKKTVGEHIDVTVTEVKDTIYPFTNVTQLVDGTWRTTTAYGHTIELTDC